MNAIQATWPTSSWILGWRSSWSFGPWAWFWIFGWGGSATLCQHEDSRLVSWLGALWHEDLATDSVQAGDTEIFMLKVCDLRGILASLADRAREGRERLGEVPASEVSADEGHDDYGDQHPSCFGFGGLPDDNVC